MLGTHMWHVVWLLCQQVPGIQDVCSVCPKTPTEEKDRGNRTHTHRKQEEKQEFGKRLQVAKVAATIDGAGGPDAFNAKLYLLSDTADALGGSDELAAALAGRDSFKGLAMQAVGMSHSTSRLLGLQIDADLCIVFARAGPHLTGITFARACNAGTRSLLRETGDTKTCAQLLRDASALSEAAGGPSPVRSMLL